MREFRDLMTDVISDEGRYHMQLIPLGIICMVRSLGHATSPQIDRTRYSKKSYEDKAEAILGKSFLLATSESRV